MNATQNWVASVNETMAQNRCHYDEAWRLARKAQPDLYVLMSAFGATRQAVQFFNSRLSREQAAPDLKEARRGFREAVQKRLAAFPNSGYDAAFNFVQRNNPELAAFANGKAPMPAFANDGNGVPLFNPQMKAAFFLPSTATQAECEAAWQGNGETSAPVNPGKICDALCALYQRDNPGASYEAALQSVKARFPVLWKQVEAIAGKKS